ncbi:hypothetical protein KEM52_005160, partial [Ascosphaera acerosa]
HAYRGRPPTAKALLVHYTAHAAPRPSLIYVPDASPPLTIFSVAHARLLLLVPATTDTDPLFVLEFLHRVVDVLEEFVCNGGPLLGAKIVANYEVVAQLLDEMCDGGLVCSTEPNTLREMVEVPGWLDRLLGTVGLPSNSTGSTPSSHTKPGGSMLQPSGSRGAGGPGVGELQLAPSIPWRRPGVRHTSNELYVDVIESLNVIMAPSGRILSAIAAGSILFTAKVSGVPELTLTLTAPGGAGALRDRLQLPVFHQCVRARNWRERPGELRFVPPDGRFVLAGYEVDLFPVDPEAGDSAAVMAQQLERPFVPAVAELRTGLGPAGTEFQVRLTIDTNFPGAAASAGSSGAASASAYASAASSRFATPSSAARAGQHLGAGMAGFGNMSPAASPSSAGAPAFSDDIVVSLPVPAGVRNVTDLRASRGEAAFAPGDHEITWTILQSPVPDSTCDATTQRTLGRV